VENSPKWKEFTNLKPGTYMAYKSRQYGEKDGHKLMKAILYKRRVITMNKREKE
jgi:hypothetical protein